MAEFDEKMPYTGHVKSVITEASSSHRTQLVERLANQSCVRFLIAEPCALDDIVGQLQVRLPFEPLLHKPVPQRLLIQTSL